MESLSHPINYYCYEDDSWRSHKFIKITYSACIDHVIGFKKEVLRSYKLFWLVAILSKDGSTV